MCVVVLCSWISWPRQCEQSNPLPLVSAFISMNLFAQIYQQKAVVNFHRAEELVQLEGQQRADMQSVASLTTDLTAQAAELTTSRDQLQQSIDDLENEIIPELQVKQSKRASERLGDCFWLIASSLMVRGGKWRFIYLFIYLFIHSLSVRNNAEVTAKQLESLNKQKTEAQAELLTINQDNARNVEALSTDFDSISQLAQRVCNSHFVSCFFLCTAIDVLFQFVAGGRFVAKH
jgi:cell division protein FtsB